MINKSVRDGVIKDASNSPPKQLAIPATLNATKDTIGNTYKLIAELTSRLRVVSRTEPCDHETECPATIADNTVQGSIREFNSDLERINAQLTEILHLLEV